jgi:hypothetical protein
MTRQGCVRVNDLLSGGMKLLVTSEWRMSKHPPLAFRHHRATGYAALETSISSRSALASSMRFTILPLSCISRTVLVRVTQD